MRRPRARAAGLLGHGRLWPVLLAAGAVGAIGLCWTATAGASPRSGAATSSTPPATLTLSVAPKPGDSKALVLTSQIGGGGVETGHSVSFFVVTTQFGKPYDVSIGIAPVTNATADLVYEPTWTGTEEFIAKLSTETQGAAQAPVVMPTTSTAPAKSVLATATARYRVTVSAPGPLEATANPSRPLSFIGRVFAGSVLTLVALIWLMLLVMLGLIALLLPRLGRAPAVTVGWQERAAAFVRGSKEREPVREPVRRSQRVVQVALGLVWLADGALQFQPFMFGRGFVTGVLLPAAQGNPRPVADSITAMAHFLEPHIAAWNALFATVQVLLGVGLLLRRTVKPTLVASFAWALLVWWFGEGLGGILAGLSPLAGGIGCIWYLYVGMLAWPRHKEAGASKPAGGGLLGDAGARIGWGVLWVGSAALLLQPANLAGGALSSALKTAAGGQPGWYARVLVGAAHLLGTNGTALSAAVAAVMLVVGLGVVLGWHTRILCGVGALLAVVIWIFPESLGGIATGQGTDPNTGPLIVLAAVGLYLSHEALGQRRFSLLAGAIAGRAWRPIVAAVGPRSTRSAAAPLSNPGGSEPKGAGSVMADQRAKPDPPRYPTVPAPIVRFMKNHFLGVALAGVAVIAALLIGANYPVPRSAGNSTPASDGGASTSTAVPINTNTFSGTRLGGDLVRQPRTTTTPEVGPGPVTKELSEHGYQFKLGLEPNQPTIPSMISLDVSKGGRSVNGAGIEVTFGMLEMKMSKLGGSLRQTAPGRYAHSGFVLGMGGHWLVRFEITPRGKHAFSFTVVDRVTG